MRQRSKYIRPVRQLERRPRMNEQIQCPEVLLINEDGTTRVIPTTEALRLARESEFDLIEVSPKANPPVVKIGDFGHYLYALQKKERKQRSHSKQTETKMLRFGFRTERHDLDRLLERAREFLAERHLVKFAVRLRGRELTNKQYAVEKLKGLLTELSDVSEIEQEIKLQGNQFFAVVRAKAR